MKKILSMLLVLSTLLTASAALADGMEVQVISGQNVTTPRASPDDVQLEATIKIPGWGDITPTGYEVQDCAMVRKPGQLGYLWVQRGACRDKPDGYNRYFDFELKIVCDKHAVKGFPYWAEAWVNHFESGTQADYVYLDMDILNTTAEKKNYLQECSVKAVYNDTVEYAGWFYQRDMDLKRCTWLDASDNFDIDSYYTGYYVFGCTMPKAILDGKGSLKLIVMIDGNEITYNIRK